MFLRSKIAAIVGIAVIVMMALFLWYYRDTQNKLKQAAAIAAVQTLEIQTQKASIAKTKEDIKNAEIARASVNIITQNGQKTVDKVRKQLSPKTDVTTGETITLGKAAIDHSILIQNAINHGTSDQLRCIELSSGNQLTEEEKNGKKKNSICPELLNVGIPIK